MKKNIEGRKAVLETVSKNGRELENFPEFQDDREIVMAAVFQLWPDSNIFVVHLNINKLLTIIQDFFNVSRETFFY